MLFKIYATSRENSAYKPCNNAKLIHCEIGRKKNDYPWKKNIYQWAVDINSVEDLINLHKELDEEIIIDSENDGYTIEIYDTWRE